MIPQDKHLALRHLARKGHIAFPQCLVRHIGLIQQGTVYCHVALCINTHHIPGQSDDALQKHLVLPGNAAKLGSFVALGFQENQYIPIAEGGFHAVAGNLDHPAWCRYHKLPALTQSLDLTDYWAAFEAIPQVHFVCEDDTVIPPDITIRRIGGNAPVVVLPAASHASGWLKYSAQIYGQ